MRRSADVEAAAHLEPPQIAKALNVVFLSDPGADSFADLGRWHLFPERSGKLVAFVVALRAEPCWSPGARPNEVSVNQGIDFTVQS